MKKTVILSTNDNPDYLLYMPYTIWAWNKLGWDTVTFYLGDEDKIEKDKIDLSKNKIVVLNKIDDYRDATIVQVSRLFGAMISDNDSDLLMTGDIDMIPLSDYWNPNENDITVYGWDLTGKSQFPICYISMNRKRWIEIMGLDLNDSVDNQIKIMLDKSPNPKSDDFEKWWSYDQQYITEKLLPQNRVHIDRGFDGILAKGRADRYDWEGTKNKPNLIDAHLPRPFNLDAINYILLNSFRELPCYE